MRQSFHGDLIETTLRDFIEHYERGLDRESVELLGDDIEGYWLVWDDEPIPGNPGIKDWELFQHGQHIRITRGDVGTIGRTYLFWYSDTSEPGPLRFRLHAERFSRGRLNIVIIEEGDKYAKLFRAWLALRWGGPDYGYIDRSEEAAAATRVAPTAIVGRRRDPWNQRAINRLLEREDQDAVFADWITEYTEGTGGSPAETEAGESSTWYKRVWMPYQKALMD